MKKNFTNTIFALLISILSTAQPWVQDDAIFNPSGIPSLPFSQPRLADLDGDGDFDLVIGSIDEAPKYFENTGSASSPAFSAGADMFSMVDPLDSEMAVFTDIDADGDLDMVTGGYTGLHLFLNTGTPQNPEFEELPGFFTGVVSGQNPIPDFSDLDEDGDPDMVLGFSESGMIKIYENTGTPAAGQFSETSSYGIGDVGLYAYPVFCDPDGDSDSDLVVGRDAHGFVVYENTGTPASADWETNEPYMEGLGGETYWNSPTLADLNADGQTDLVFGTASGPLQYFEQNGSMASPDWSENTSIFGGVLDAGGASNPCFYDFDSDGDLDMISGSQLGDIKYYRNTGTASGPAWEEDNSYFASIDLSIYSDVSIGDVNADGLPDAVCGDLSGNLFYYRNTGEGFEQESGYLQGVSLGGWSSPCLYDMDDDEDTDIIAGAEDGTLHYIENQGTPDDPDWVEIPDHFGGIDVGSNCVAAVTDIDFDGDADVICGNLFGSLSCFLNQNGSWFEDIELFYGIAVDQNAAPGFGDLDNDGDPDLALGQYSGTFSYFRNQHFVTGSHPVDQNQIELSVHPNPVLDQFVIHCMVQEPSQVEMSVFRMDGQKFKTRQFFISNAGINTFWIDAGSWPAGVYILVCKSGSDTGRIKLIKK